MPILTLMSSRVVSPPSADDAPLASGASRVRELALAGLALLFFGYAYRALLLQDLAPHSRLPDIEEFLFSPSGSSPTLIFLGSFWMLSSRWRRLRSSFGTAARPWLGLSVLGAAAVVFAWSRYVAVPILLIPSLSLLLIGIGLLLGGLAGARSLLLPALFLLLAVPMPSVLVNGLIYPLQLATARWTTALLDSVGLVASHHAEFITRPDAIFQVIESCSGLRMLETLLMSAVLYSELFRTSWARTVILLASVPALSVLCNQIRVISIVLNPYSHFAAVHTAQGLVMVVMGVLFLAGIDALAGRLLGERAGATRSWKVRRTPGLPSLATLASLLVVSLAFAAASSAIEPWPEPAPLRGLAASLPAQLGDWSARGLKTDHQFLGSTRYDDGFSRRYWRGEEHVDLFLARDLRLDPARSLLSRKTELPGARYVVLDRSPARILGREVETLVVSDGRNEELVYHVRVGSGSFAFELGRVFLALDRGPLRRPGHLLVLRLNTPIPKGPGGRRAAEERIAGFLAAAETPLRAVIDEAEAISAN